MLKRSPLAPERFPDIPSVPGVRLAGVSAGVKGQTQPDLFLAELAEGTAMAGVLTKSLTASSSVEWCREQLKSGTGRGIVVNAGNANAFTGSQGAEHTKKMAQAAAATLGCSKQQIYVASTGVIGEPLPVDRISNAIPMAQNMLAEHNWEASAEAISTTDTFSKGAFAKTKIDSKPVTIAGIAKGSGMIAPDMATMLAFVFTDAAISAPVLTRLLRQTCDKSFNCITVDSDTSTSDTLLLCATGRAGNTTLEIYSDPQLRSFKRALQEVMTDLATQVVKDGEGASKFIIVDVTGATSRQAAKKIALSIANSPLVKTAIAGEDANWGRVVMAVGKAGQKADRDRLKISMGGVVIAEYGQRVENYDESLVNQHLKGTDIHIGVDIGLGKSRARVWTCDLTHGYISINADYRS